MAKITLKGQTFHTIGDLPKKGAKAPDFHLLNHDLAEKSLKDFAGKRKLLYALISVDTSVCSASSKKLNEFAKKHPELVILVISADLPFALKRFCAAEGTKNIITLSTMRDKGFGERYGLTLKDGPLAGLLARAILVLDEKDTVQYVELVPEIAQEPDYEPAFQALLKIYE